LDFGEGQRVTGFAVLFETASTSKAGFSLFRRDRLIEGGFDEGWRPEAVFGKPNDYAYQRLFGELHLEGFDVTHTKDGFKWREYEDGFDAHLQHTRDLLLSRLIAGNLPLAALTIAFPTGDHACTCPQRDILPSQGHFTFSTVTPVGG